MTSLIEKIQLAAIDRAIPVSDLLRKVKLAAAKLKLEKVEEWVDHELKGYKDSVPDYRKIKGVPVVDTLYQGQQPLQLPEGKDHWSEVMLGEPIAALEHSIAGKSESFIRPYPAGVVASLSKANDGAVKQAGVRFSASAW